jgi:Zn-dependent peptidase ImmA (M78 family)/transcriptional regulator with XRE-family HTH domain
MEATEKVIAENLVRNRIARGMSQSKVAEMAGISRAAYQKIEKGQSIPRVDTLQSIASAMDLGLMDLVREATPLSAVRFRSRKKLKTRQEILVKVGRWLRDFNYLEDLLNDKTPCLFPDPGSDSVRLPSELEGPERARAVASQAREIAKLKDDEPILDVCGLLESKGIKVYPLAVASGDFFGLAVGATDGGSAVVVNVWNRLPVERWIFSACHELGHLVLHLDSFNVNEDQEKPEEEKEADTFASYFLMPAKPFKKYLSQVRGLPLVDRVLKIKRIFGVSYKTVLKRLIDEGLADNSVWGRFNYQYQRIHGKKLPFKEEPKGISPDQFGASFSEDDLAREPNKLDPSDFIEDRLGRLVRRALEDQRITMSRASEILGLDLVVMKELVAWWGEPDDDQRR